MILYYTGPTQAGGAQVDPELSLGGYISSSPVSNGTLNNIFPNISKDDVTNHYTDTRCIALTNTLGRQVTNVTLFTTTPLLTYGNLFLGVQPASLDAKCNCPFFESISDGHGLPFSVQILPHETIANAIVIPTLNDGQSIGIWIERILNPSNLPASPQPCQNFTDIYKSMQPGGTPIPAVSLLDNILISIQYT